MHSVFSLKQKIIDALVFQGAWFCSVFSEAYGKGFLGVIYISVFLIVYAFWLFPNQLRFLPIIIFLILGSACDSVLHFSGAIALKSPLVFEWGPAPFMLGLWALMSVSLQISLSWLHQRYILGVVLGGFSGAFTYFQASKIGALEVGSPTLTSLVWIFIAWAICFPMCQWTLSKFKVTSSNRAER